MELQLKTSLLNFNKNIKIVFILTISFIIFTSYTYADKQVYGCTDKNGNAIFTDTPDNDPNCLNPKLKMLNPTLSLPNNYISNAKPRDSQLNSAANSKKQKNNNYSINFTSPNSGETINRCGGTLDVSFSINPSLAAGDTIEIYLDGGKYSETTGNSLTISGLDRGAHSIEIKVISDGSIVATQSNNFHFLRNCARRGA